MGLTLQVADVVRILGSVRQMVKAGNRVAFDEEGSYIEHKASKKKTSLYEKGGGYAFAMNVRKESKSDSLGTGTATASGSRSEAGFHRQASLVQKLENELY